MKLIICGGRDYHLTEFDRGVLTGLDLALLITEVVSGGCAGADLDGEAWAKEFDIPVKQFLPDWVGKKKSAGPLRNREMAEYADACIAFPGGGGTADMVKRAEAKGLKVFDLR